MPAQRILYVEGNVDGTIGGSYFSLLFLATGVDRERFEPIVAFAAPNLLLPRFAAKGVRTLIAPSHPPKRLPGLLGRIFGKVTHLLYGWLFEPLRLARLLRHEKIRLVHLNNSIISNHAWMIAALFARIPCITHERGINAHFRKRARVVAKLLDAVICISAAVKDNFIAHGLANLPLVSIHNGLDPAEMRVTRSSDEIRAELSIAPSARLVGIVGNIKPWKGQEVVIRAMAQLKDEYPDVVCLLIGDTSPNDLAYRIATLQLIDQLGLNGRVLVTGYRQDVANYLNMLDIQIHASIAPEPFGRVLLEGMALSKPLIASGGGAVPEIVDNGVTGLLFEPGNPQALAHCLRILLADPARATAMGAAGKSRLEANFTIAHNIKLTQEVYSRLLTQ